MRLAAVLVAVVTAAGVRPEAIGAVTARVLSAADGIPPGPVSSLLAADGRLYVGTSDKGLVSWNPKTGEATTYTRNDGLPSDQIKSIAVFRGRLYAGTSEGIAVREGDRWSVIREADGVNLRNAVLAASPDGRQLWAAATHLSGGLVLYDGKSWKFMGGEGRGLFNDVNSFAFFRGGVLMGAMSGAVYARRGVSVEPLQKDFPGANVYAVAERGGSFYAGTSRGLFVWRGRSWEAARVPESFQGRTVFALLRSDLDLVVGGVAGLLVFDGKGNQRVLSVSEGVPASRVRALAASGGTLYVATESGVAVVEGWR